MQHFRNKIYLAYKIVSMYKSNVNETTCIIKDVWA